MLGIFHKKFLITALAVILLLSTPSISTADTLGQSFNFRVDSGFDIEKRSTISATLRHVGAHAYFYVDDLFWDGLTSTAQKDQTLMRIRSLSDDFDSKVYPKETSVWGSEPNPGIDGDSRVTILLEKLLQGSGGYFETVNGYSKEQAPESNAREMIVVGTGVLDDDLTKAFIAHEFQHLISFKQKEQTYNVSEETWLNELRSEYSPTLVGYSTPFSGSGLERRMTAFLQNPTDSLTEWPNLTQDYAPASMFAHYLVGRFGLDVLAQTLHSALVSVDSLNDFFAKNNLKQKFSNVFLDWLLASYMGDISGDGRYGYKETGLQTIRVFATYQSILSASAQVHSSYSIKGWQPLWHEFRLATPLDNSSGIKISLNSVSNDNFPFAATVFYDDGTFTVHNSSSLTGRLNLYVFNSDTGKVTFNKKVTKVLLVFTHDPGQLVGNTYSAKSLNADLSVLDAVTAREELTQSNGADLAIGGASVEDGVLIKRNNSETEMYVVEGKYKRYLRPEIIALYGHLNITKAIPVSSPIFDSYTVANYVRVEGDKKVWVIWPDGTRHWLNITGEQFSASGRDWNAIFTISDLELAAYRIGVDITK